MSPSAKNSRRREKYKVIRCASTMIKDDTPELEQLVTELTSAIETAGAREADEYERISVRTYERGDGERKYYEIILDYLFTAENFTGFDEALRAELWTVPDLGRSPIITVDYSKSRSY